ncbi:hypothetical protein LCGC14_0781410 [marine sediment metagenome]|uniref:Uncharacterized protein n=1 Tax=marine sediment metagenome TaxID=412755 RepID=A0A0F9PZK9_9ZZZZ
MITIKCDGEPTCHYPDISFHEKEHKIVIIVYLDGRVDNIFFGDDSGKMRASIEMMYQEDYSRSPDRVLPLVKL